LHASPKTAMSSSSTKTIIRHREYSPLHHLALFHPKNNLLYALPIPLISTLFLLLFSIPAADSLSWRFAHSLRAPTSEIAPPLLPLFPPQRMLTPLFLRRRVGVFATLTNSFALVAVGASENFYRYVRLDAAAF